MRFISRLFTGAGIFGVLGYLGLIIAGFAGYVMNILAIISSISGPLTTLLIVRIIGCFAFPLGAILGWY